ncbi:unnamed protein product [Ilex paraguariensis]|uniref:Uncharacterized protein n=1 Tax=Ilex paraguariensis TaxID=185542 RepID=A0ABC8UR02_9AQUA
MASDLNRASSRMTEAAPEVSGSFLAYSAFVLLIFTIFYNALFATVIKPSIDGEEPVPDTTTLREAPEAFTELSPQLQKFLAKPRNF